MLHAHGAELQRTTRGGVAYFCPSSFFAAGEEIETITVRPRLSPLSLLDQVRAVIEPHGWRCGLSDKGIYAAETARLFGGEAELVAAVRRTPLMRLLNAFVRGQVGLRVGDGRRCLSAPHIEQLVGSEAQELIDSLLSKGVLTRGLVLKCRRCRRTGWYSLVDLGQMFACRRCRLEQPVDRQWVGSGEPAWFYELAEVVHQFIEHNGDLPVLAVDQHFASAGRYIARAVELEFSLPRGGSRAESPPKTIEVDFAVLDGHRLWLGEAATELRPSRNRLKDLRTLARGTNAHGFLLATAAKQFPSNVVDSASAIFSRRPLVEFRDDLRAAQP